MLSESSSNTDEFPITANHLRSVAGALYYRGEAYFKEGRVVSCTRNGRTLEGEVDGTERYRVKVIASPMDGLVSSCSCPIGFMCKHAIALVLAHLGKQAEGTAGRPPMTAPPERIEGAFTTREELDGWAKANGVEHTLWVSAEPLCAELTFPPQDYWIKTVLARLPLREVGALELAARHARARGVDVALAKVAYRTLHREAELVETAKTEEAHRLAIKAECEPAWSKLITLRAELRTHASPRPKYTREVVGSWKFDPSTASISWKEKLRVFRPQNFTMTAVATKLSFDGAGKAVLECTCPAKHAQCTHAIALVDATLDVLSDPDRLREARQVVDLLLQPGWARALAELDRIESRVAQATPIDVWWRITGEPTSPTIAPVIEKSGKRGKGSTRTQLKVGALLEDYRHQLRDKDLAIAEALHDHEQVREGVPMRALMLAINHPRTVDDDDRPLELVKAQLGFTATPVDDEIRIEPAINGARLSPKLLNALLAVFGEGEPIIVANHGAADQLFTTGNRWTLVEVNVEARRLWTALSTHGDLFPPEAHSQLLDRLGRIEPRVPVVLPDALKGKQLAAKPVTVARLRLTPEGLEIELFVRAAPGTPLFPPGCGPKDVLVLPNAESKQRGYVRRDLTNEPERTRITWAQLPIFDAIEGPPFCFSITGADEALAAVQAVQDPPPNFEAEWVDIKPHVGGTVALDKLRVKVERKKDWFQITGDVRIESSRIELAILLDAVRRQQKYVRVDANRWVELSDQLRQRLQAVADQTFETKGHGAESAQIELSPGAVPAIQALEQAGAKVDTAASWAQLAAALTASKKLKPKPPKTLKATLRDYQIEGHAWLTRVAAWGAGACLADDMGLGKTVQAIAVLIDRSKGSGDRTPGPALVLAPTSVIHNWVAELEKFAPTLRPVLFVEGDRMTKLVGLGPKDVVIASYGVLVRDVDKLAAIEFETCVFDEAQALKNHTTQRARAARALKANFRIALSGTPFENHLGELWSLFTIIFPGLFGSWDQFRERYAIPIEKHKDEYAQASLSRVLSPFLLRRTKQEVARELPARTEIEVSVALSDEERALYEDARIAALAELAAKGEGVRDERRRFQVLAAITRLRLLACHPKLYDPNSTLSSAKLARAVELLEELRESGHRALVFSQFTSHLALVRAALDAAGFKLLYLDGATTAADRKKLVAQFQTGDADAFLISLKAGGMGINLTGADYVLHLDPWWNPAVEDQATDRAHRIGQTKPVTVYRLISRETIEDQILALHKDKRALVASVLAGTGGGAKLTTKDLLKLISG